MAENKAGKGKVRQKKPVRRTDYMRKPSTVENDPVEAQKIADQLRKMVTDYAQPGAMLRRGLYPLLEPEGAEQGIDLAVIPPLKIPLGIKGKRIRFVHGTSKEAVDDILKGGIKTSDKLGSAGNEPWVSGFIDHKDSLGKTTSGMSRSSFGDVDIIVEVPLTKPGIMKEAVEPSGGMVRVWRDIKPEEILDIIDRRTGKSLMKVKK